MEYGLIGETLLHSFSKEIHAHLGDYDYTLAEISRSELPEFMARREFRGINVTVPYKEAVIPYLDELSPKAERTGAVNTVINRNGKLVGYNTDYEGLRRLVMRHINPAGKTVLILGSGGTSKTALSVMEDLDAKTAFRASRSGKTDCITYHEAKDRARDIDIIINTTPCGMYPSGNEKPISVSDFPNVSCVLDAVYNPLRTELVLDAQGAKISACGGLYMLTAQAVAGSGLFTGEARDETEFDRIYKAILTSRENIILIGMPGCGKTTVGRKIAYLTGRDFVDTDDVITMRVGCSISDYFEKYGENAFRDIEEQVIRECAANTGTVIATGGGAVLRDKNVRALKSNGRLVFIDKTVNDLIPTGDRPLAQSRDDIMKLFRERYQKYITCADMRVSPSADPKDTAERIMRYFFERELL